MNEHHSILDEWKARVDSSGGFISDGIVDRDRWATSPRKVLLILKEGYNETGEDLEWDLCAELRAKPEVFGVTLREAAYWLYCVQKRTETPNIAKEDTRLALLSAAVINVKKTPGGKTSTHEGLNEEVERCRDLLKKQIAQIDPDIVVCGSTWTHLASIVEAQPLLSDYVYRDANGTVYVNYWHPANRFPRVMNCMTLVTMLNLSGAFEDDA